MSRVVANPKRSGPTRATSFFRPIVRIALRDADMVLRSKTWLGLCLAPLLLVLLMGGLLLAVVILLVGLKLILPEGKDGALGTNQVAVVIALPDDPAEALAFRQQLEQVVLPTLATSEESIPHEARLFQRGVAFVRALRAQALAGAPAAAEANVGVGTESSPATRPRGVTPSQDQEDTAPTAAVTAVEKSSDRDISLKLFWDDNFNQIAAEVPDTYDAALHISAVSAQGLSVTFRSDAGLLASRVMERRLKDRVLEIDRTLTAKNTSDLPELQVVDEQRGPPDPWLLTTLGVLVALGFVFMYHSVAAQAVAGVLAGERDQRTLDVLLSLPLSRRQILYGKMSGLLIIAALPALFWSSVCWLPALFLLPLPLPWGLPILMVCLQAFLMATGVSVSASSPDLPTARNRLGMVNLTLLVSSGLLLAFPAFLTSERPAPLTYLMTQIHTGGVAGNLALIGAAGVLMAATLVILEAGLYGFKRLT